jgi:predicted DNA-binding transcriptional regulator AlpA
MNGNFELITQRQFAAILHSKPGALGYLEGQYEDFPPRVKIGKRSLFRLVDVINWLRSRFEDSGIEVEDKNENSAS